MFHYWFHISPSEVFVALLQEYLQKHQKRISTQAENEENSSISYGNCKKKNKAITAPFSYGGRRIRVLQVFILGPAYQTGDMAHAPGLDFYLCTHNFH